MEKFVIRSKIWIEDTQGNVVFGLGRYRMLQAIDRHNSLMAASKELKMSYRALWGRIKASEERMQKPLVVREGKGSKLSPFAQQMMMSFGKLQGRISQESDTIFAQTVADAFE